MDNAGISYVNADANYISAVNGISEFSRSSLSGWLYTVDGKYPDYGVNEYMLDSGDVIILHFTDDYTKEESSTSTGGSSNSTTTTTTTEEETTSVTVDNFTDIDSDSWYYDAVSYVVDSGLFNGTADDEFSPNGSMTRAMVMTVLHRLSADTDYSEGETWYEAGMNWSLANGISDGTNPSANVSRQELVTMLYRYANASVSETDLSSFSDADSVASWASEAMSWAVSIGIITGKSDGILAPTAYATRSEVATIIMRFATLLNM